MKYKILPGAALVLVLILSACTTPVAEVPSSPTVPVPTELSVTKLPVSTATQFVESYPGVEITPTATMAPKVSAPAIGGTTVKARLSDRQGLILVNGEGLALYLYKKDTQNGEASACTDVECTSEWIPLTTDGAPVAGAGAIQKFLGTITRGDGASQVTYNGWPLYLFGGDHEAGSTNGQGSKGEWFLVSPSGMAISK